MEITPYQLASRFIGLKEVSGNTSNPQILAMLKLDNTWPTDDSVPWCSAFLNFIFWLPKLSRSKSLLARSWLEVGEATTLTNAKVGHDVVILKRGIEPQPDATVINAPGHVGLFSGYINTTNKVALLAGNQNDMVSVQLFDISKILGIRRILQ